MNSVNIPPATAPEFFSPIRQWLRYVAFLCGAWLSLTCGARAQQPSITLLNNAWEGLSSLSFIEPPDPHGVAGPAGILQVINLRISYWSKTGAGQWTSSFAAFFSNTSFHPQSDPRAAFDPATGRFYVEILELDFAHYHSYIDVAVSKSSNPLSGSANDWFFYRIENTRVTADGTYWGDYSTLGYDAQGLYVSLNMYTFPPFRNGDVQVTIIDKMAALNGTTNYSFAYIPGGDTGAFTLQPCTVLGTNNPGNVAFYAETLPGNSSTNVRVWAITDPLGARTVTAAMVSVPDNGGPPPDSGAPQLGTTNTIDTLDGRTQGIAYWLDGSLWFCATLGGNTGKSVVYYYRIDLNGFPNGTPSLGENGSLDGGDAVWTYQPAIGGNSQGDVCLVYCASSTNMFPTIYTAARAAGSDGFSTPLLLKASPGFYRGSGAGVSRWGDYASVSADPVDGTFWVTHEWAKTSNPFGWSTWWANVSVGTPPSIVSQPASQTVLVGTPLSLSVNAQGTSPLLYQWQYNGASISGATASAFLLEQIAFTDAGSYSVTVTNAFGFALSSNALFSIQSTLVAWGENDFSQSSAPPLTNTVMIAAGGFHNLALRADGTVVAWGNNYDGQCNIPSGLTNGIGIAAGGYHSLAIRGDHTLVGWGANYYGQTTIPTSATNIVAVAAGEWHSLALRADGTVLAWGDDTFGQTDVPARLTNVVAIAAGAEHSLALRGDGTVVAWGSNLNPEGTYAGQATVPAQLKQAVAIAGGAAHSLALRSDGTIVAWGDNTFGQITIPPTLGKTVAIGAGGNRSLAIQEGGGVFAWGENEGQEPPPSIPVGASAVAAGNEHNLVLLGQRTLPPRLTNANRAGHVFSLTLPTIPGKAYFLQYKNSLSNGAWWPVSGIVGDGTVRQLVDTDAAAAFRCYRVRQQ